MKSGYMVMTEETDFEKVFTVYRLIDALEPDVPKNREVAGRYSSHDYAIREARKLNKRAAERFWKGCQ